MCHVGVVYSVATTRCQLAAHRVTFASWRPLPKSFVLTGYRARRMVSYVSRSFGLASCRVSKLPVNASRIHHLVNNLASQPKARMLYVGTGVSAALWDNSDTRVHWVDEDLDLGDVPPRPDVHPYNLVIVDKKLLRPGVLYNRNDKLDPEFIFVVLGWNSSDISRGVERELKRIESTWDCVYHVAVNDNEDRCGWDDGVAAFVMQRDPSVIIAKPAPR